MKTEWRDLWRTKLDRLQIEASGASVAPDLPATWRTKLDRLQIEARHDGIPPGTRKNGVENETRSSSDRGTSAASATPFHRAVENETRSSSDRGVLGVPAQHRRQGVENETRSSSDRGHAGPQDSRRCSRCGERNSIVLRSRRSPARWRSRAGPGGERNSIAFGSRHFAIRGSVRDETRSSSDRGKESGSVEYAADLACRTKLDRPQIEAGGAEADVAARVSGE